MKRVVIAVLFLFASCSYLEDQKKDTFKSKMALYYLESKQDSLMLFIIKKQDNEITQIELDKMAYPLVGQIDSLTKLLTSEDLEIFKQKKDEISTKYAKKSVKKLFKNIK